jgi:hypothetical protein
MKYIIRDWNKLQAKKYGLTISLANDDKHKLEVYDKSGTLLGKIGAIDYKDYAQYLDMEKAGLLPDGYADNRRRLYYARHQHEKGFNEPYSRSWLARVLLW